MKTYEITTYQLECEDSWVGNANMMFKGKKDEAIEIAADLFHQRDIDGVMVSEIRPIKPVVTIFNKTPKTTKLVEIYSQFDDKKISETNAALGMR